MKKIVVIGGGAAGAKAASKAKRLEPNNHVELYTNEDKIAYSLCGLPYYIEGSVDDINKLIIRTPQDFIDKGIPVFLNHEAQEIYPDKNCILINGNHIFYDELILALGAKVNIPKVENANAKNIFTLRSLEDGVNIKNIMQKSKSVLLVGGGYIGIELTEAFIKNGLNVKLVEFKDRLASDFDDDFSKIIQDIIVSKCDTHIEPYFSRRITKFEVDENYNFKCAITDKGDEIYADFCVLATGASPNVELAKKAGIHIGTTGAIYVDSKMRTNYKNIYACGDCTEAYCIITKIPTYIGLGTIANKEGRSYSFSTNNLKNADMALCKIRPQHFFENNFSYLKQFEIKLHDAGNLAKFIVLERK